MRTFLLLLAMSLTVVAQDYGVLFDPPTNAAAAGITAYELHSAPIGEPLNGTNWHGRAFCWANTNQINFNSSQLGGTPCQLTVISTSGTNKSDRCQPIIFDSSAPVLPPNVFKLPSVLKIYQPFRL